MKQFITCIFILISLHVYCQSVQTEAESSDYYLYTQFQLEFYKMKHADLPLEKIRPGEYHLISSFIQKQPKKEICFSIIAKALDLTASQVDTLIGLVDSSMSKSPFKNAAIVTRNRLRFTETGKIFPAINITDSLGNNLSFEALRGNLLLIDLWSSWCVSCRAQIPELIKIYSKYKSKGFEIIGISMDEDKSAWLNAVHKDNQNWKQYCDLQPFSRNKIAKQLSVYAIPANFLLDRNGIILGQDLSPEQISLFVARAYR